MPADQPLIGETWQTLDQATGRMAQAVVSEASPEQIHLINRLARHLMYPLQSFLITWTLVAPPPEELCAHGACMAPGYLQVQDLGRWVWVCQNHLPAWVQPLLPTDHAGNGPALPGGLDQCPLCDASTRHLGSSTTVLHDTLTLHRCGQCSRRWVLLIGTGSPGDGHRFAEAIPLVAGTLEDTGLAARALAGHVALTAICRATGTPLADGVTHVAGVEVGPSGDRFGSNAVIVVGEAVRTGIQRLGGQPDQNASYGGPEEAQSDRLLDLSVEYEQAERRIFTGLGIAESVEIGSPPPVGPASSPRVGSTWWPVPDGDPVQVKTVEYGQDGTEQIRFTDNSGDADVLTAEDFHDRYVPFNPDPPGEAGDEFIDGEGKVVFIRELLHKEAKAIIYLSGQPASTYIISFQQLRTSYTKIDRRSAFERIMDEDDL